MLRLFAGPNTQNTRTKDQFVHFGAAARVGLCLLTKKQSAVGGFKDLNATMKTVMLVVLLMIHGAAAGQLNDFKEK